MITGRRCIFVTWGHNKSATGGWAVLLQDSKYVCVLCGAEIDVTPDQRPVVVIRGSSGKPNVRCISLDGMEIHACPFEAETPSVGQGR